MIKQVFRSYFINIFALWVTASYIGSFQINDGLKSLFLVSLGFTLLHLLIKPITNLFLGPLNFLTLGLIGLVVDSLILYALTLYFPQVAIIPWFFPGSQFQGFVVPAYNFDLLTGTIISALVINVIRSSLLLLSS